MRYSIFLLAALVVLLVSCKKEWDKDKTEFLMCDLADVDLVCTDGDFEDYYNVPSDLVMYDVEAVVVDPTCNCIVQGWVKYLRNGITVAMVDYGNGECDRWAVKVHCVEGDCDHPGAYCCKFEQACEVLD